ncbi:hypothetical protein JCM8547_002083 [Rhodosporidiobolus lusitaniae]
MSSTATLRSTWLAIAEQWPKDVLRPNRQLASAIRSAADRAFLQSRSSSADAPAQAAVRELSRVQQKKASEAAESLRRLMANEAFKQHPMSERTTKPASFPKHYSRILDSIAKAEKGEVFKKPAFSWFRWK